MNDSKIPVRYAKALFDTSMEKKITDAIYDDMRMILFVCSMKEVREVLDNPVIAPRKRKEILVALFPSEMNKLTMNFIDLIFSHGRENYLGAAARDFIELTRKQKGIRQVTLTTAVQADDKIRSEIAALIAEDKNEKIEFVEQVDKSIMGGFVLRVDDSYIDASVRSRLNRFKKEFSLAGNAEE